MENTRKTMLLFANKGYVALTGYNKDGKVAVKIYEAEKMPFVVGKEDSSVPNCMAVASSVLTQLNKKGEKGTLILPGLIASKINSDILEKEILERKIIKVNRVMSDPELQVYNSMLQARKLTYGDILIGSINYIKKEVTDTNTVQQNYSAALYVAAKNALDELLKPAPSVATNGSVLDEELPF